MKRIKLLLWLYLLFEVLTPSIGLMISAPLNASAQNSLVPFNPAVPGSGFYYASGYNYGNDSKIAPGRIAVGAASGATTITLASGSVTLADGRTIMPYSTSASIIVGLGTANQETVTPSTVAGCAVNAPLNTCLITATFANAHGAGELIASGTSGLQEAIADASAAGGGMVFWVADGGIVTLATGAAGTTVCSSCILANSIVLGVMARVTTTITGCSSGWELGDGTTLTRYTAVNTTLTAGTVSAADQDWYFAAATPAIGSGPFHTAAKSIVATCTGSNASAGAMHVRAFGYVLATPNF